MAKEVKVTVVEAPKTAIFATYVWLDAAGELRSKIKVMHTAANGADIKPTDWAFDGSSTGQAEGTNSDRILRPVYWKLDPLRSEKRRDKSDIIVFCQVLNPDGTPHESNNQHFVAAAAEKYKKYGMWFGIEQEYFLLKDGLILGWPKKGKPAPQGPYYCSAGADRAFGRNISDEHLEACAEAGLAIWGTNAEVAPGQWEFQIGPLAAPDICYEMWIARYLLVRIAEKYGVTVSLDPKPKEGWNGSGCHTNFGTAALRGEVPGVKPREEISRIIPLLEARHNEHIAVYGAGNERRLSGKYETSDIHSFSSGKRNRAASIRDPQAKGYLEDRRPAANMEPEKVVLALLETVCGKGFEPKKYGWVSANS